MKLTRRTNVLLTDDDYFALKTMAKDKGKTVGGVIRELINQNVSKKSSKRLGVMKLIKEIEELTKGLDFSGIDYKALVEDGRKY